MSWIPGTVGAAAVATVKEEKENERVL